MRLLKGITGMGLAMVLSACGGGGGSSSSGGASAPHVDVTGSCASGYNDCTFTASAVGFSGESGWDWNFGDGSTQKNTDAKVTHTFAKAGTYTVKATADGVTGSFNTTGTMSITVRLQPVVAAFTADCDFFACTFDAASTKVNDGGTATYKWTFGDGTGATGVSASTTYGSAGAFTVTLDVSDSTGAKDSASEVIDAGNVGAKAAAIQQSIQLVLSYDNYAKAMNAIDAFARTSVQSHGARTSSSGPGSTLTCPGGGSAQYFYWTDGNHNGTVDNDELYDLVNPKGCAGTGGEKVTSAGAAAAVFGEEGANLSFTVLTDGSLAPLVGDTTLANEAGWVPSGLNFQVTSPSAGQLAIGLQQQGNGMTAFGATAAAGGYFLANPFGSANFPQDDGMHPLDGQILFGGFTDNRRQSGCTTYAAASDEFCQAFTTDSADTKSISASFEWGYGNSVDGTAKPSAPLFFFVQSTTNIDIESTSRSLYMKAGEFTIIAFNNVSDYGSDTQAYTLDVTATTDGSGNPAFSVSVNGGAAFTIRQDNWVTYPHVCGSSETGLGCTP